MTKIMCKLDENEKSIYFDCMNHAGMKDVCIICSTLCKVLLEACRRADKGDVKISDGHVKLDITDADSALMETFACVSEVFKDVEAEFPDNCKIY